MRIENNTVLRILAHEQPDSEDVTFWFFNENSNLTFRNNIFVYAPSRVEPVFSRMNGETHEFTRGKFTRENNLYYRLDEPVFTPLSFPAHHRQENYSAYTRLVVGGGASLGKGEQIGDPLFVDFKNRDLRLRQNSPAIDAGADLGYTRDFDGNPIPDGAAPDIGAYEFQSSDTP